MPDTKHLKRRGQTWYVVVAVPRNLKEAAGTAHFVKALGTRDLKEANRRKHHWVGEFKRRIEHLKHQAPDPHREVFAAALRFRELLDRYRHTYSTTPQGDEISEHEELMSEVLQEG
jgi:hypothetical protein